MDRQPLDYPEGDEMVGDSHNGLSGVFKAVAGTLAICALAVFGWALRETLVVKELVIGGFATVNGKIDPVVRDVQRLEIRVDRAEEDIDKLEDGRNAPRSAAR